MTAIPNNELITTISVIGNLIFGSVAFIVSEKRKSLKKVNKQLNKRIFDLEEENTNLKILNNDLETKLNSLTEYSLKDGILYNKNGDKFCPVCKMPLQLSLNIGGKSTSYICPKCGVPYLRNRY